MLDGLAPARRRLVLVTTGALLTLVLVLAGVLLIPRLFGSAAAPVDQARPGPVLLVPGYGGSTTSLQVLAQRLSAAGRDATVITLPGDGTGDLTVSAGVLGAAVTAAVQRTGAPSVDLIGYSAGGIVVRLWLADGGAATTRRVVLLGSPNHGTAVADLAAGLTLDRCPPACQQLTTGSDVLARLDAGNEIPSGPAVVSIWTTQDQTVTPPDSARLTGAVNLPVQSICAAASVSHSDLPRAPLVQAMVLAELTAGPPAVLTAADCGRLSS